MQLLRAVGEILGAGDGGVRTIREGGGTACELPGGVLKALRAAGKVRGAGRQGTGALGQGGELLG